MNRRYSTGSAAKQSCLSEKFSLCFINKISQYLGNTIKIFTKMQGCEEFLLTKKFSAYKLHYSHILEMHFPRINRLHPEVVAQS